MGDNVQISSFSLNHTLSVHIGRFLAKTAELGIKLFKKIFLIGILLTFWQLAPTLGWIDPFLLPAFTDVVDSWWRLASTGILFEHVGISLYRAFSGYGLAILISIPTGLAMGWYTRAFRILNPIVQAARNTSTLALFPLFILFFGLGESARISVITYGCIWYILLNTITGVQGVDSLLIKSARSMTLRGFSMFYKVIIPGAFPSIITGLRLSAAASILVLVGAEMIGASQGIGYFIFWSQENYQVADMYAGILTISVVGILLNATLSFIEKRATLWSE